MEQRGEGSKANVRMRVLWALDRPQRRERLSARLRKMARDEEDGLADLRRLAEERVPRTWHL